MDILVWLIPTITTIVCTITPIVIKTVLDRKKAFPKIINCNEEIKENKKIKIFINEDNFNDESKRDKYFLGKLKLKNIGKNFCVEQILINNIPFEQREILVFNEVMCIEVYNYNKRGDLSDYNVEDFSIIISNEFEKFFICKFSSNKEGIYYNFELTSISKIYKKP